MIFLVPNPEYCYWDAKSLQDTCPLVVYTLVAILILFLSAYRLIKFKKLGKVTQDAHYYICIKIYILIIIWSITYLAQNLYSVISYFHDLNDKENPPNNISTYSKVYTILDKIPAFVVQTIFLTVCIFNYEGLNNKLQVKNFKINHTFYKKYIHYIYKARIFIQILGIISLIIYPAGKDYWEISTINIFYVIFDQLVISSILIYSIRMFVKKGIQPNCFAEEVKRQIKREYLMMIVTDILGLLVNLIMLIIFPYLTTKIQTHTCIISVQQHWQFFFGHNIFGLLVQHLIPIFWFLKMYNYGSQNDTTNQESFGQKETNPSQEPLITDKSYKA